MGKQALIISLIFLVTGCGSSGSSKSEADTYANAKANSVSRESSENDRAYNAMRAQGISQEDAKAAVDAARDLCPHTDANGKCI